jgi:rare lipoprotein A (peptidoglycan hydrolase)
MAAIGTLLVCATAHASLRAEDWRAHRYADTVSVLRQEGPENPRAAGSAPREALSRPKLLRAVGTGYASWYGRAHQGRLTASGEVYDMRQLTAAHPTLPMGTRLRVTNLRNGRSVAVRVNDRGPTVDGRIIDLSYAAAQQLHAVGDGVVPVRLDVVSRSTQ